ncbi:extensin-like [Hyalella azteca]|uniref:Extensin-like n=1 Tax=Hyalella azteca TaxID=294128 RepID=A0A8B7NDV0_HYAAZ|nr:extensin-like [Hyalella azteca]
MEAVQGYIAISDSCIAVSDQHITVSDPRTSQTVSDSPHITVSDLGTSLSPTSHIPVCNPSIPIPDPSTSLSSTPTVYISHASHASSRHFPIPDPSTSHSSTPTVYTSHVYTVYTYSLYYSLYIQSPHIPACNPSVPIPDPSTSHYSTPTVHASSPPVSHASSPHIPLINSHSLYIPCLIPHIPLLPHRRPPTFASPALIFSHGTLRKS